MISDGFITSAEWMWDDGIAANDGETIHTSLHVTDEGDGAVPSEDLWIALINIQVAETGQILLNRDNALQLVEALNEILERYPEPPDESED